MELDIKKNYKIFLEIEGFKDKKINTIKENIEGLYNLLRTDEKHVITFCISLSL